MWSVRWSTTATKGLRKIEPEEQRVRIVDAVDIFASTGRGDVKKLRGSEGEYRLRVGSYRIRFAADTAEQRLDILRVSHRQDGY